MFLEIRGVTLNIIRKFIIGSTIAGCSLGIGSCGPSVNKHEERFNNFMADKPYETAAEINNKLVRSKYPNDIINHTDRQLYMDSVAYRDIFNATHKANDSTAVADFNKIASEMKAGLREEVTPRSRYTTIDPESLKKNLGKLDITLGDYNKIMKETHGGDYPIILQYKADSIAYRNFFQRHNLLNDTIIKKIANVTKKIRP